MKKKICGNATFEDAYSVASNQKLLRRLDGKTVFITGATGLVGSRLTYSLLLSNALFDTDIRIIALVRNPSKARNLFSGMPGTNAIHIIEGDVLEPLHCTSEIDYIVHSANVTDSRYFVSNPVETINVALCGTKNVLELAKEKDVQGVLYLSSLEIYGTPRAQDALVSESDYGYINILNVRSSYSESKRMCETLCAAYAGEYDVPVKIARLAQTFGAGVSYEDQRVFAEFARCVLEKRNIVLHTAGETLRTYCYIKDAVEALLYVLLLGKSGEAYNVSNPNTAITIRDMAELVCNTFPEANIKVVYDCPSNIASYGYNPEMRIALDSSKIENLGWRATTSLPEMFIRMIAAF